MRNLFLLALIILGSNCSYKCEQNDISFVSDSIIAGANAPSFGEAGIDLVIEDTPYASSSATMWATYYGFNEDSVSFSYETNNISVLNYIFSEDSVTLSVSPLSDVCSLVITISDGEKNASREIVGYSTDCGVFYDDSINHAQRKYVTYLRENESLDDRQFDTLNQSLCSDNEEHTINPTINPNTPTNVHQGPYLGRAGRLFWKDPWDHKTFPLKGVQVELIHYSWGFCIVDESTNTDEDGRYSFTVSTDANTDYHVRINAINEYAGVEFVGFWNYYRKSLYFSESLQEINSVYYFDQTDDISKAMQITQALYYGGKYAEEMSGRKPDFINVHYPSVLVEAFGAKTGGATNQLLVPAILLGSDTYKSWDVLLHEYGHWMQHCYGFFSEIPAYHKMEEYTAKSLSLTFGGQRNNLELPWQEGWPDVFALRVTNYYSKDIGPLKYVNDDSFHHANASGLSFETITKQKILRFGDCSELTIGAVLYDMYDSGGDEPFDVIHCLDEFMWGLAMDPLVKNFNDFCQKVYSSHYISQDAFGKLLSHYGMAVDNVTKNDAWIPTVSPTFYLDKCNSSGTSYDEFASNSFCIQAYSNSSSSGNLITTKTITNTMSFSFSNDEWSAIMHSYGPSYSLRICSIRTNPENPAGNYWSKVFTFSKPTNSSSSYGTFSNSTRMQQTAIDLYPSSYYERTVSFTSPGYKIFQTLGSLDSKLKVFNADNVLIAQDDNNGYGNNALIGLYCNANTEYRIKVMLKNSYNSGKVRLLVSSSPGFRFDYGGNIERYEDIVNLSGGNWIYGCWALQYESLMITYTPGQSGYHTISLTSVFDNYLYVIDPRSSKSMFDYGAYEYDDNGGPGYNARLWKHLDQGVPYLIVFCQYDPSRSFTNLDEGDDLEIKIEVW